MERTQALNYLKEIKKTCRTLFQEDTQLMEIKTNVQYAVGHSILIRSFLNSVCKNQVSTIAQKYHLAIQEELEGTMIYQPKPNKN